MNRGQWLLIGVVGLIAYALFSLAPRHLGLDALVVLGLFVLAPYWLGPPLVWATNRCRVPRWQVVADDGLEAISASVRPFFERADAELAECGFRRIAALSETGLVPGFRSWVTLHVNGTRDERAVAMAHVPQDPRSPVKPRPAVYFRTKLVDGRSIETGNVDEISPFPPLAHHDGRQFPEIADARRLHRLHQLRVAPYGSALREVVAEDDEVDSLTRAMAEFYSIHVGTGYLRVDEPGRSFRPTSRGAALMTWKLLPPASWMARRRNRARNRAFLEAHGMAP